MDILRLSKLREQKTQAEQQKYLNQINQYAADVLVLLNQKGAKMRDVGAVCGTLQRTLQNYIDGIVRDTSLEELKQKFKV